MPGGMVCLAFSPLSFPLPGDQEIGCFVVFKPCAETIGGSAVN